MKGFTPKSQVRLLFVFMILFINIGCAITPPTTIYTTITSDPPGADIYFGTSKDTLVLDTIKTPITIPFNGVGAYWKPAYYQVKKEGYEDSEIVFKDQETGNRVVHFKLIPKSSAVTTPTESSPAQAPTPSPSLSDQTNKSETSPTQTPTPSPSLSDQTNKSEQTIKIHPVNLPITPQISTEIELNCAMNGFGEVTCTFRNAGDKKDSVCVQTVLFFAEGSAGYMMLDKLKNDKAEYDSYVDSMAIGKTKICSGLVEPKDVRQLTQNAGFGIEPRTSCQSPLSSSWNGGCSMQFIPISN